MKRTLTKVFQLAIALSIGGLAMTVYIQHRELAALQTADLVPESSDELVHGAFAPRPGQPQSPPLFPPPPVVQGNNR